jgi:UDP-N-acetylmuramoyl-L-alanyl-D-glutamate--2,6-diaminopimelate ligase
VTAPLESLLQGIPTHESPPPGTLAVSGLCYDSRRLRQGDVFFALPGARCDGRMFLGEAASRGAVAAVVEEPVPGAPLPVVVVPDAREAMAHMASQFHGHPSQSLRVIGITGTNGKTTTAFLCRHILDAAHRRCGLLGTVKYVIGGREIEAPRTTPESPDLQEMLAAMRDEGCKAVAMEVSSHALRQRRTTGIAFDAAVFTNLSQDHLDYHKTMEAYFDAKALLFEDVARQSSKKGAAVINADDRFGSRLATRIGKKLRTVSFGFGAGAHFRATDVVTEPTGSTFHLEARGRTYLVRLPLIGAFNVSNALAALAACSLLGVEIRAAVAALANTPQVPGRLERVAARRSFQVFVDYAHTDDALRNVLRTLRSLEPTRVIVVVGCGGDRDRGKRPLMASAAGQGADWVILTSDNPRSEDPAAILEDMRAGLESDRHEVIADRAKAIGRAVEMAEPGDIVLIAGKGHEAYQELADRKVPFDDRKVAQWAIEARPIEFEEAGQEEPWTR